MQVPKNKHVCKYSIYRDGILHSTMTSTLRDVQSALITFASQAPVATWEYVLSEQSNTKDQEHNGDMMLH